MQIFWLQSVEFARKMLLHRNEELNTRFKFEVERLARVIEQTDSDSTGLTAGSRQVQNTLLLGCSSTTTVIARS